MAYDITKLTTLGQLKTLADATKTELDKKAPIGSMNVEVATDEEFAEMMSEIFGIAESSENTI